MFYLIQVAAASLMKFGITDNLRRRFQEHQNDFKGSDLRPYWCCESSDTRKLE